ncbi:uncharacterized protein A4U43_C06F4120 [Asparagus officinalis]|uniref:Signal peptidase complex subunit 2 n=1 Tax=Asparagus officinalis TaxID=4686 RepID=A0A5P1ELM6_ASPOF|nr:uncharacterized protein A4U43_C06F4120 [Asparagus officinalis]
MARSIRSPKKANLLDQHSIKHLLDESVTEIVKSRGYVEDVRLSNAKSLIGAVAIGIALLAQFYPEKFPDNRDILIVCIGLYPSSLGSFSTTGLIVSSKLPRFANDGMLVEGLFWKDVERLIDDYNGDLKSTELASLLLTNESDIILVEA